MNIDKSVVILYMLVHWLQACLCLALSPTSVPAVNPSLRPTEEKTLPWLVAGYSDGTVRLFDLNRVEMILKLHPHASSTTAVCFSADGEVYQLITSSHYLSIL